MNIKDIEVGTKFCFNNEKGITEFVAVEVNEDFVIAEEVGYKYIQYHFDKANLDMCYLPSTKTILLVQSTKSILLDAYNTYAGRVFGDSPIKEFVENGEIGMAYTSYESEDSPFCAEIQVDFDVNNLCYKNYVNEELVAIEDRSDWTIEEIANEIRNATFEGMIETAWSKCAEIEEERKEKIPKTMQIVREHLDSLVNKIEKDMYSGKVEISVPAAFYELEYHANGKEE